MTQYDYIVGIDGLEKYFLNVFIDTNWLNCLIGIINIDNMSTFVELTALKKIFLKSTKNIRVLFISIGIV